MRFRTSSTNRAGDHQPAETGPGIDEYVGSERRGRPMSIATRLDLFFLSLWLIAAGVGLVVMLVVVLFGFIDAVPLG